MVQEARGDAPDEAAVGPAAPDHEIADQRRLGPVDRQDQRLPHLDLVDAGLAAEPHAQVERVERRGSRHRRLDTLAAVAAGVEWRPRAAGAATLDVPARGVAIPPMRVRLAERERN